jgi:hypothetical protein
MENLSQRATSNEMLKVGRVVVASLLVALLAVLYGASPASAADTQCNGVPGAPEKIGAVTVDQVVVPDGGFCRLVGTTVNQNVIIGVGSNLQTRNAQVGGNIQGTNGPRAVRLIETDVQGNIQVKKATHRVVIGDDKCTIDPYVGEDIQLEENLGGILICQMEIGENLQLFKNTGRIVVLDNDVGENMQITDNTGDALRVRDNQVGTAGSGSLQNNKNQFTLVNRVARNSVKDTLECFDNVVAPTGGSGTNTAGSKIGQCAAL